MTAPTLAEVRAELERILASPSFAQAGRASDFLRLVVNEALSGAGARLKGYTIAVEVFGRPPNFDPQTDPLVRVEAGRLRSRLVEYYETDGAANPIRISLPRGTYAPTWEYAPREVPADTSEVAVRAPVANDRERWYWLAATLAAVIVVALTAVVWLSEELGRLRTELATQSAAAVSDEPRVVVFPLENLTPEHAPLALLAAGMTEEIMLALGARDLRVIAGDRERLESHVVRAAGAGYYVLSGSVRGGGEGEHIRIALRLIDPGTGTQLWSRAYDQPHEIERLPDLQAQVAREVAAISAPYGPIFEAELARAQRSAGAVVLRECEARYFDYRRTLETVTFRHALECYQRLSLTEPDVGAVWAGLAMLYLDDYGYRYGTAPTLQASFMLAREATEKALALDRHSLLANMALARVQFFEGHKEDLEETVDAVLAEFPESAEARVYFAPLLTIMGSPRGVVLMDEAVRISPNQPPITNVTYVLAYMSEGRFADALAAAQKAQLPNWFIGHMAVAAAAGLTGDARLAERARWRLLQLYPNFESEALDLFDQWQHTPALRQAFVRGLRAAGLAIAEPTAGPSPASGP